MKILVVRFSSIGDIVLTSPVLRCLREQTGAEVHFLTKRAFAGIVEPNPYVARVFSFEKNVREIVGALRRERYDCVIDLHRNLRSWYVKRALGRPAVSFQKYNFAKWLLVNAGTDRMPKAHVVDRYMATTARWGVRYDGKGLDFFIPPEADVDPAQISPILKDASYIALVVGAAHATKRIPKERITAICEQIKRPVVLLGGKAEQSEAEDIAAAAGPHVVNACGRLSLQQSASLVRQAAKVVAPDTGLMHIAAAFSKEIVSVWGSTTPRFGMYPFYPEGVSLEKRVEVQGLACRPCSKIGYARCPKGHFRCMLDIAPTHISGPANAV